MGKNVQFAGGYLSQHPLLSHQSLAVSISILWLSLTRWPLWCQSLNQKEAFAEPPLTSGTSSLVVRGPNQPHLICFTVCPPHFYTRRIHPHMQFHQMHADGNEQYLAFIFEM